MGSGPVPGNPSPFPEMVGIFQPLAPTHYSMKLPSPQKLTALYFRASLPVSWPTLSVERAVLVSRNIQSVASVQSLPKALQLVVPIVLVFYGSVHL